MNLAKTSLLSGISTVIRMINGFVVVKIIAVYVGASGLALIGQFQNFISIIMSFATGAINGGVVKYTAEFRNNELEKKKLWSTAIRISLTATLFTSLVLILFHNYLSNLFFKTDEFGYLFIFFAVTLFLFVLNSLLLAILNGQKEIKKLTLINIVSSFVGLLLTGGLAYFFGLHGALTSYTTGQALVFFVTLVFVLKSNWFKFNYFNGKLDKSYMGKLGGYTAMALTVAITGPISLIIVRNYIGDNLSWNDAGYWDGMWKISATYLGLVTTTLSIYYLPRLSEIKENKSIRKEILSGYKLIMPIIIIASLGIYALREHVILLLFTKEFAPMKELFFFQLIGDVFKISSWLLSYLMVAKAMIKTFIITEIGCSISFASLSIYFVGTHGLIGVTMSYAISYFIYFIVMLFIFKNLLNVEKQ